jgi:hypothetical protein
MTGVVPGRFSKCKLLGGSVEDVATVPNPVWPGDQVLSPTTTDLIFNTEAADHIPTVDGEASQRRAHFSDNGATGTGDDLVLFARGRSAHEPALYRQGRLRTRTVTLGLLCRQ